MRVTLSLIILSTCIVLSGISLAQSSHEVRTIVINDTPGQATVYQIDGRFFVDIESLARIANGSISFRGDQIILSIPNMQHASADSTSGNEMSPDFVNSAIQTVAALKEWTSALAYAVQKGIPGDGSRIVLFHDRAAQSMSLTRAASTSDSDQQALALLNNHFDAVQKWSDKLISERKSMDTGKYSISADALNNDESYRKITSCGAFLNQMIPTRKFQDNNSCH